jgi:hypothetical protein
MKVTNTLAYSGAELLTASTKFIVQATYSQHFIFLVTFELTHQAIVLHYIRLEMLVSNKHSSLLSSLVSYE